MASKTVRYFNDHHPEGDQIELSLEFTKDVRELDHIKARNSIPQFGQRRSARQPGRAAHRNPVELLREFAASLKVYRDVCREHGREPEEPFSGKCVLRVDP